MNSSRGAAVVPHELSGRVALVTGAGVRVGRAIAEELARAGAAVAVHYGRSESGARQTVRQIAAGGGRAKSFAADLRDPASPAQLVAEVLDWAGRHRRAGVQRRRLQSPPLRRHRRRRLARHARGESGSAVQAGPGGRPGVAAAPRRDREHPGRGGVSRLERLRTLRDRQGGAGHVDPGAGPGAGAARAGVWGGAGDGGFSSDYPAADRARVLSRIPLGRVGKPSDVAGAVRFLCHASYVTGSVIVVDGGRMAGSLGPL